MNSSCFGEGRGEMKYSSYSPPKLSSLLFSRSVPTSSCFSAIHSTGDQLFLSWKWSHLTVDHIVSMMMPKCHVTNWLLLCTAFYSHSKWVWVLFDLCHTFIHRQTQREVYWLNGSRKPSKRASAQGTNAVLRFVLLISRLLSEPSCASFEIPGADVRTAWTMQKKGFLI